MGRKDSSWDKNHEENDQKPTEKQEIRNTQHEQLHLPMDEVFVLHTRFIHDHF